MEKTTEAREPVISLNIHTFVPPEDWSLFFLSWGAARWGQEGDLHDYGSFFTTLYGPLEHSNGQVRIRSTTLTKSEISQA